MRAAVATVGNAAMVTGLYPLIPHLGLAASDGTMGRGAIGIARVVVEEWASALAVSALRPMGFLGLPGRRGSGPRPIVMVHGYAMNRANFVPLSRRLAARGLGPISGFEYWSLGSTARAARRLGRHIDRVLAVTGASQVDIIGHSMGGVVGRYFVQLDGGSAKVRNLITIGSPHGGTDIAAVGIGRPAKELYLGSAMLQRLEAAPLPEHTAFTVVWSRADALVPGAKSARVAGVDEIVFDDMGHLRMLLSARVAKAIADKLVNAAKR